jgi:hypothetical protein
MTYFVYVGDYYYRFQMLLRQRLSSQPRATACLHLPRAVGAAGEGCGSAAAAGLDVFSCMSVVGSAGL